MEYKFFEWTPDISVGEPNIDGQHQKLLGEVNTILSNLIAGADDNIIREAISFLNDYIDTHFAYEEKYMQDHGYPEFETHKSFHQDFIKHYDDFKQKFENKTVPRTELISQVETYIGNWWLQHIKIADKKYATFIESQNK